MTPLTYIFMASSTWLLGFLPYFEIYMAVPAGILIGLPWIDAFFWGTLGNWMAVVFIDVFYEWLLRFKFIRKMSQKSTSGKWKRRLDKNGSWAILIFTPLAGIWTTGVVAKIFDYDRKKLWIFSGISISVVGFVVAICTILGVKTFS